jgi:murein L,D-transpeptidase YcbB/YkuD
MDMKPETERGQEYLEEHQEDPRPFKVITYRDVSPRVPVYIIYYTAYPDPETGEMNFWPDLYGYDKVIRRKMGEFIVDSL